MKLKRTGDKVEGACECCKEIQLCTRCKDGSRSYIFCDRCLKNMKVE